MKTDNTNATISVNKKLWHRFKKKCFMKGNTYSETVEKLIKSYK